MKLYEHLIDLHFVLCGQWMEEEMWLKTPKWW